MSFSTSYLHKLKKPLAFYFAIIAYQHEHRFYYFLQLLLLNNFNTSSLVQSDILKSSRCANTSAIPTVPVQPILIKSIFYVMLLYPVR